MLRLRLEIARTDSKIDPLKSYDTTSLLAGAMVLLSHIMIYEPLWR
jgi:hypothetical protein